MRDLNKVRVSHKALVPQDGFRVSHTEGRGAHQRGAAMAELKDSPLGLPWKTLSYNQALRPLPPVTGASHPVASMCPVLQDPFPVRFPDSPSRDPGFLLEESGSPILEIRLLEGRHGVIHLTSPLQAPGGRCVSSSPSDWQFLKESHQRGSSDGLACGEARK